MLSSAWDPGLLLNSWYQRWLMLLLLLQIAKEYQPFLYHKGLAPVFHPFSPHRLDYCNVLYLELSLRNISAARSGPPAAELTSSGCLLCLLIFRRKGKADLVGQTFVWHGPSTVYLLFLAGVVLHIGIRAGCLCCLLWAVLYELLFSVCHTCIHPKL